MTLSSSSSNGWEPSLSTHPFHHVKMHWNDGHLWTRKLAPTSHQTYHRLISDFPALRTMKNKSPGGFLGGSVVKKKSSWQCRSPGFGPWSRRSSHAEERLSPCTTAAEPALQRTGAATTEAQALYSPCSATREETWEAMRSLPTATKE